MLGGWLVGTPSSQPLETPLCTFPLNSSLYEGKRDLLLFSRTHFCHVGFSQGPGALKEKNMFLFHTAPVPSPL